MQGLKMLVFRVEGRERNETIRKVDPEAVSGLKSNET